MIQLLGAAANQTFEMPSIDYHQIAPILLILAAPHQLWVQIGIARITHLLRRFLFILQH